MVLGCTCLALGLAWLLLPAIRSYLYGVALLVLAVGNFLVAVRKKRRRASRSR